ncbi:hypothetical protein [Anaeromassilibacillus senegalensis]|uniref:hypothetical protein n=1 Tax=Anaeromassilibacillus senegalensis TaxID=1673717 RepID=UPI0012B621C2|nr:hypothetical protein [Anaeromassilibacillus senegalensis]
MTYEDTASVSRTEPVTGANNITKTALVVKYSEIICALSYTGSDKSNQTKAQNEVEYDAVIFAAPDLLVLPGDSVILKRFGRDDPSSQLLLMFEVVGRPAMYATHQEIRVKDGDLA